MKTNIEKIKELINFLNYHTYLYDRCAEVITDKEWDKKYFELKELEEKTGLVYPDSPTQSIYFEKISELKKIKHNHLMLSLDKTKNIEDIKSFINGHKWIAMAKLDGLTCSLRYLNGKLVSAETRGNELEGENVTHNAKVISSIPQKINYKEGELIIDGEIICTYKDFTEFQTLYKNPRNFASGSIRLLDSRECKKRKLTFVAWDAIIKNTYYNVEYFNYYNIDTFLSAKLGFLNELGFITVPALLDEYIEIDKVIDFFKTNYIYPIDGIVFKYDNIYEYNAAGHTAHHFKGGLAYKFYDEIYETKVKNIEWTMGRTGQLTPVLIYEDINIDGSICNRANLHNITVMTKLMGGAYPGQKVYIYKANEIIPQVKSAEGYNGIGTLIEIPKKCPYCGKPTEIKKENNSEILYCSNPQCENKLINKLEHFCGKKGLDIKGLSKATFQKLIDWGWLKNLEEIFYLNQYKNEWVKKDGFGITSVNKVLNSIEKNKKVTLDKFISALGIPLIGEKIAKEIVVYYPTWEEFRKAVGGEWSVLEGFGPEIEKSINNFNYTEADKIAKLLIFKENYLKINNFNLKNKKIVITGKLELYKNREELKKEIEEHGGKVVSTVNKGIFCLINNDKNSQTKKNKTAKLYNVPIITEKEFVENFFEK